MAWSLLFVQVTLSHFSEFKIISVCHYLVFANKFIIAPRKQKIFNSKVASHILLRVRRLSVSYRMNVRTSQKMLGVHR